MKLSIAVFLFVYFTIFLQICVTRASEECDAQYLDLEDEEVILQKCIQAITNASHTQLMDVNNNIMACKKVSESIENAITARKIKLKTSASNNSKIMNYESNKIVLVSVDTNEKEHKYTIPTIHTLKEHLLIMILEYLGSDDTHSKFQFANQTFYNKIKVKSENFFNFFDTSKLGEEYNNSKEIAPHILPVFKTNLPLNLIFNFLKAQKILDTSKFPWAMILQYLVVQKSPSTKTLKQNETENTLLSKYYSSDRYNFTQNDLIWMYDKNGKSLFLPEFFIFEFHNEDTAPQIKLTEDFELEEVNDKYGNIVFSVNLNQYKATISLQYSYVSNKVRVWYISTHGLYKNDNIDCHLYSYYSVNAINDETFPEITKTTFTESKMNPIIPNERGNFVKEAQKEVLRIKSVYSKLM